MAKAFTLAVVFGYAHSMVCAQVWKDTRFEEGCRYFDEGKYFEAHDEWEELWMESTGEEHSLLQGLIQTSVGLYHSVNQNYSGTRKLFATALKYLDGGSALDSSVAVEKVKDRIFDFELALQKILQGEKVELPYFKLPRKPFEK